MSVLGGRDSWYSLKLLVRALESLCGKVIIVGRV